MAHAPIASKEPVGTAPSVVPGGLSALAPVARQTVQDQVYGELRENLIHGMFDAGEVLKIRDLAERLSVSTMPVREALGRLVSEHAVEPMANRSVRVPLITRERLDDLARVRRLIEGELTALAVPLLSPADIDELKRLTDAYDALAGGLIRAAREVSRLNHAFHFTIYRAAGSPVLIPVVESLWMQSGPYVRAAAAVYDGSDGAGATNYHRRLIEAIDARDADAARAALSADIGRAFDLLRGRVGDAEGSAADD
ncbi:GntR family transcriptional regulator [Amorphus orientalis]|uniref:DNA-binding GntR family transcriptional regulator n=1 Tax=Amorphus orientalis TaxID=649198 RepID=A0AAE4ARQ7_9HYPH|nr:GntR family transcriptional regulator [Amorphus orientalis]MDQ0315386.1 DNA-binding GntR family transcriptional regulator [Amorphus orientalis]